MNEGGGDPDTMRGGDPDTMRGRDPDTMRGRDPDTMRGRDPDTMRGETQTLSCLMCKYIFVEIWPFNICGSNFYKPFLAFF